MWRVNERVYVHCTVIGMGVLLRRESERRRPSSSPGAAMRPRVQGCRYITAPSMAAVNQTGWAGEERGGGGGEERRAERWGGGGVT